MGNSSSCLVNRYYALLLMYGPQHPCVIALGQALELLIATELELDNAMIAQQSPE